MESGVGAGTEFRVYLPRVDAAEGEGEPEGEGEAPRGRETVLLVEDEAMVRKLACVVLMESGYRVLEAGHGEEALRICEERGASIDLLVTDVVMPKMSGKEVADRLVSEDPGMKVLYMSGYTDDAIVRHGVLEAGVAFIEKPFMPEDLSRKVREVLDQ